MKEQITIISDDLNHGIITEKEARTKLLILFGVSNWVAISSTEKPEIMTDVMVKYKDGRKEVAYFDGDKRFYIEKDDRDVTEIIVEWNKLP
jgi:hypothetical protein